MRGKIIITGTGRAGTSFLMQLFTMLGEDTGFTKTYVEDFLKDMKPEIGPRAGFELGPGVARDPNGARIVKAPPLCRWIQVIANDVKVEAVVVPIRRFEDALRSREFVQTSSGVSHPVAGGTWAERGLGQKETLLMNIYEMLEQMSVVDAPLRLIRFPKLVKDPLYLWGRIQDLVEATQEEFVQTFHKVVRPELVHFNGFQKGRIIRFQESPHKVQMSPPQIQKAFQKSPPLYPFQVSPPQTFDVSPIEGFIPALLMCALQLVAPYNLLGKISLLLGKPFIDHMRPQEGLWQGSLRMPRKILTKPVMIF